MLNYKKQKFFFLSEFVNSRIKIRSIIKTRIIAKNNLTLHDNQIKYSYQFIISVKTLFEVN